MSLHVAAQHLASKGRDGDSTLVHMSPGEVKGLQALAMAHGGSLSINPDTGLVEASFLKRILPMVAGAALSPFLTPMGAAALVGGFESVRTGDIGKGLMAGLGAYGGAGLTSGLSTAGAQTGVAGTTTAGVQATPIATTATENVGANALRESAGAGLSTPISAPPVNMGAEALKAGIPAPVTMGNVGAGFSASPSSIYNALPTGTLPALGATAMNAMTPEPPPMPGEPEEDPRYKGAPYRYNLSPNFSGAVPRQPQPYYRATGLGYAAGGDVMMAQGGAYSDEPLGDVETMAAGGALEMKRMGLGEGIYRDTDEDTAGLGAYEAAKKRMEKQYAAASLKANKMPKSDMDRLGQIKVMAGGGLGGYSDGGRMLKGPGDGMSDSIPATIGRKQPARLADGEFVVPADVVSHLGNGSTDAGAKQLYAMMDKIRKARTGKKKQAPAVKASKYLPV